MVNPVPLTLDLIPAQEKLPRNPKGLQKELDNIKKHFPFGKTSQERKDRKKLWRGMDYNGNGYLSLNEIDDNWKYFGDIPKIMNRESVIHRAFNVAKSKVKSKKKNSRIDADEFVTWSEFRFLLQYICEYY